MNVKESFKQALKDRGYVGAFVASCIALIAIIVLAAVEIRPSELQVPIRNTVFGITYTYREQWYNELSFVGFAILVWGLHTLISAKLYMIKDRRYAVAFMWLTAVVLGIAFFVFMSIFRVISVVE